MTTVLEKAPELEIRTSREAELLVADITFHDLTRDTVTIRVKVRNDGELRSSPARMRLESAPFGAFVPSRPLAVLPVPALEPGESRELRVDAARPHPTPLGDFDGVPPRSLLTTVSASPDDPPPPPQPVRGFAALLNRIRQPDTSEAARPAGTNTVVTRFLPPDLWEFFGREQPHWAGNINVFIGDRAVERHMARALRIHSGRTNLAMFMVGGQGQRDAYAFDLAGLAPDWKAALYDVTSAATLRIGPSNAPVPEQQWVESAAGAMLVVLAVQPPADCENGKVEVHVIRRSCQKTAVVEFDLDPTAQGPGCYVA